MERRLLLETGRACRKWSATQQFLSILLTSTTLLRDLSKVINDSNAYELH